MNVIAESDRPPSALVPQAGYTMANLLVATGLFMIVMGGILSSHIFGLKLMALSQLRMEAADGLDYSLQGLIDNLRSAQRVCVGQWTANGFNAAPAGLPQQGNAVQIYPVNSANQPLCYYLDPADSKLKLLSSASAQNKVIFESVANSNVFAALDLSGGVLTNQCAYETIGVDIRFFALDHSLIQLGSNQVYSSYEIRTQVARRTLD